MTSNDNYVTVEMFNAGIQEIKNEMKLNMAIIDGKLTEIRSEIQVTNGRIDSTNGRIDNMTERLEDLKFFGSIGIAVITVLLAIIAFKREKPVNKSELSERDLRAIMREEIRMAQNVAVGK